MQERSIRSSRSSATRLTSLRFAVSGSDQWSLSFQQSAAASSFPGDTNPERARHDPPARSHGDLRCARGAVGSQLRAFAERAPNSTNHNSGRRGRPVLGRLSFPDGASRCMARQGRRQTGSISTSSDVAGERHYLSTARNTTSTTQFLYQMVPTANAFVIATPTRLINTGLLRATRGAYRRGSPDWRPARTSASIRRPATPARDLRRRRIDPHRRAPTASTTATRCARPSITLRSRRYRSKPSARRPRQRRSDNSGGNAKAPFPVSARARNRPMTPFNYRTRGPRRSFASRISPSYEHNVIDVLPTNFRDRAQRGRKPQSAIGVPTNAGQLVGTGSSSGSSTAVLRCRRNYNHALLVECLRSSLSTILTRPAILAGHLFPANYVPNFTATLSYEFNFLQRRLRITPVLSYESAILTATAPRSGCSIRDAKPEQVPNDNYVNPGYNYYFLENPSLPYNAATNPYIATSRNQRRRAIQTRLRTMPQTFVSLHVEGDVTARLTAILDSSICFARQRRRSCKEIRISSVRRDMPAAIHITSARTARSIARSVSTRSATACRPTTARRRPYPGNTDSADTCPRLPHGPHRAHPPPLPPLNRVILSAAPNECVILSGAPAGA